MDAKISQNNRLLVLQLLENIEECEGNILHLLEMGRAEDSFSVVQERNLKQKYMQELNDIMKISHLKVQFVEDDGTPYAKVA